MSRIILVSVVRNESMYRKCIVDNPYAKGCEKVRFDNIEENLPITVRYNSFLDSLPCGSDCWIVFCHEDWMPLCDIGERLDGLDRSFLYGPVGIRLEAGSKMDFLFLCGGILQAGKDGEKCITVKGDRLEGPADTFDCQCLIFHSSLIEGRDLRFDENLRFDMYVEDFCAQARERFGVESRTADIPCKHFSYGQTKGSFVGALEYVRNKYASCQRRYPTIVGHHNTFGGDQGRPVFSVHRFSLSRLLYHLAK